MRQSYLCWEADLKQPKQIIINVSPMVLKGQATAKYQITTVLTRLSHTQWHVKIAIEGAGTRNEDFRQDYPVRHIISRDGTVAGAKRLAEDLIMQVAAGFLRTTKDRLSPLNPIWIDDSD